MNFEEFTNKELKKIISTYKDHVKFSETAPSKMKRSELLSHVRNYFTYNKNTGHIVFRGIPSLSISVALVKDKTKPKVSAREAYEYSN